MKIKDVIENSALLLAEQSVIDHLKQNGGKFVQDDSEGYRVASKLLEVTNFVIKEMYLKYYTEIKTETLSTERQYIYFAVLSSKPLEILAVYDKEGNSLPFILGSDEVHTDKMAFRVEYSVAPTNMGFEDVFTARESEVPFVAMCYAVISEYLLILNRFDEAVFYREKFVDAMPKKVQIEQSSKITNYNIKKRSWY